MVKQCLLLSKDFHVGKKEPWVIGLGWVPISIFKNTFLLICLNFEKVQTGCSVGNPVGLQLIAFTQSQNFLLDFFSHGTNNNIEFFSKYERFLWVGDHNGSWINEMKPNFARTKSSFGFPIMWINVQLEVNSLWMYSLNSSGGPLFKEIRKKKLPDWTIPTHIQCHTHVNIYDMVEQITVTTENYRTVCLVCGLNNETGSALYVDTEATPTRNRL